MQNQIPAKRVWSGTFLEVWLSSEKLVEAYGYQAKVNKNMETVVMCGQVFADRKMMSAEGTGSLRMYRVSSRMGQILAEATKRGEDPRFTIVAKLNDPDAWGAERIVFKNVSFDDLTLMDAEAGSIQRVECPFHFTDFEYLDQVSA